MPRRKLIPPPDEAIGEVQTLLAEYESFHPGSQTTAYRYSPYSIRIRIIDPKFLGMDRVERDEYVWRWLARLSVETLNELTILLLLTEEEKSRSLANMDFENPIPSTL